MKTIKVIHTLHKYENKLRAGIYVREPIEGITDKHGRQLRAFEREIGVREVPNAAISRCMRLFFDQCPDLETIEYQAPRGNYITISRTQDAESILSSLTTGGSYLA